jgi:hypothetical protein
MPYRSKAQQRYFHARLPGLAHKWDVATKHTKGGFGKLPQRVRKADDTDRAAHYGRMAGVMGTLGTSSTALGAGSGVVARMERKGKDPMGFTMREHAGLKPLSTGARLRVLKPMAAAHSWQARGLGGIGAASLGAAAAYHVKRQHALAQPVGKAVTSQPSPHRNLSRTAGAELGLGSAGVGAAALHYGGRHGNMLRRQAAVGLHEARGAHHELQAHKLGSLVLAPNQLHYANQLRSTGARVAGVKGAGALAAGVATAAGGAGLYELAHNRLARPKQSASFGKAAPRVPVGLVRAVPRNIAHRMRVLAPGVKPLSTKQKIIAGGGAVTLAAPLASAAGMDEAERRRVAKAHWSDNLIAHHQAKLAYHQSQLARLESFKTRKVAKSAHWSDDLAAHHRSRIAHHQAQLSRLERFRSTKRRRTYRPRQAGR